MFPVVLGFLLMLSAAALTSSQESYIKLVPSKTTVISGEQFSVGIYAYAHVPANAIDVTLAFDSKSVTVLNVDKGQSVLTIWTHEPTFTSNQIHLAGGTYRRGFVGEHLVATVNLLAMNDGKTEVYVKDAELLAGDGKGTPVALSDIEAGTQSFIIYSQGTNPETLEAKARLSLSADIDGDGVVTLKDISAFMASWYKGEELYDFNNDQKMNFVDFSIILARSFFRSSN
jgi:hypothetical protein